MERPCWKSAWKLRSIAGLLGCLLAWGNVEVWATQFRRLTIEDLARGADAVVQARVMALETTRDSSGRIFTRVEMAVSDLWKGRLESGVCTVLCGGGTLGETEVRAVGQPEYSIGDEVVVYLVRAEGGNWVTLGMAQGRFGVSREDATGRRWVQNLFWGSAVEAGKSRMAAWPPARPLSLDELKRRTQEVAP